MTPDRPEHIDLSRLREEIRREIDDYAYDTPTDAIGNPLSNSAISDALSEMRSALVDPYWTTVEIRDAFDQIGATESLKRRCAVVADDGKGMLLLFDPVEESFALAQRVEAGLSTIGVRGDAVGCFLAR